MIYTQLCFLLILQWLFVPSSLGSQNLALGKKTAQISTARATGGISGRAVDGDRNTTFKGHCTQTAASSSPWWRVDLGKEYSVSYLTITNRGDCCSERLSNFEIRIGNSLAANGTQNPKCGGSYSLKSGETKNITCPTRMKGRYVNVIIPGSSKILTLCEVEVYNQDSDAQIWNPLDKITYWFSGSTVQLPWSWTAMYKDDIEAARLSFTKYGSSSSTTLARSIHGENLTSRNYSSYNIEGQAKLVFKNANLGHNGTYRLDLLVQNGSGGAKIITSNISVIILVQPIAQMKCSKKNMVFFCECKSDVGNPPPLVYWTKNGKNIGNFGYGMQLLTTDDITKGGPAMYSCNVKSHNLRDRRDITFETPKIISFHTLKSNHLVPLHDWVVLKCEADSGIFPTVLNMTFNGGNSEILQNGIKIIENFTKDSVGVYKCIAFNTVGSSSLEIKLNIASNEKLSNDDNGSIQTEWYMFLITCICGIFVGVTSFFLIQCLHRRLKNKNNSATISVDVKNSRVNPNGVEDRISIYDELDLKTMNLPDNNYQSLRENSRSAENTEGQTDEQSFYQELGENREKDEDLYVNL